MNEIPTRPEGRAARMRREIGARVVDAFFEGSARLGRRIPLADPNRHNVEVIHDIPYQPGGKSEHLLDIYRPRNASGPLPTVLYLHGGGFRICSKDSHWLFGLIYARRGYLVVNASYRLAPKHKYPAAHEDAFAAFHWLIDNAARFGGDPSQVILAGESAGANLCTALAVATSYRRKEPWAIAAFDRQIQPKAVIAGCGLLQVSDPDRFGRARKLSSFIQDRIDEIAAAYLENPSPGEHNALADPLCMLELGLPPERPLPPFFAFCGTWDPVMHDTQRLAMALDRLGVKNESRYYPRGLHAFHAFVFDPNARRCWRDTFDFLGRTLSRIPPPAVAL